MTRSRSPSKLEADLEWSPDLPRPQTHALSPSPNSLPAPACFPSQCNMASADLRTCKPGDTRSVTLGWTEGKHLGISLLIRGAGELFIPPLTWRPFQLHLSFPCSRPSDPGLPGALQTCGGSPSEEMLAQLGSCLLLAVALLGPGPRVQAMKGRSSWGQADAGRRGRRTGKQQPGLRRFPCGRPESRRYFWRTCVSQG